MKHTEFDVPDGCGMSGAARLIERVCRQRGLQLGMKGTAAAFRGSTHWHYKKKGEKGTLELTVYPAERRIWAEVKESRSAPWIDAELREIKRIVERQLKAARTAASKS